MEVIKETDNRNLKIEDGGFYRERHDGGEPGQSTASFTQEIWCQHPLESIRVEFGGRQTIMANFRELRDPFTLYHSLGVINGKEFILEDIGGVTTMFTKPPPSPP